MEAEAAKTGNTSLKAYRKAFKKWKNITAERLGVKKSGAYDRYSEEARVDLENRRTAAAQLRDQRRMELLQHSHMLVRNFRDWERLKPVISGMNGTWKVSVWVNHKDSDLLNMFQKFRIGGVGGVPLQVIPM